MLIYSFSQNAFTKNWNSIASAVNAKSAKLKLTLLNTEGNCQGLADAHCFYFEHNKIKIYDFLVQKLQDRKNIEGFVARFLNSTASVSTYDELPFLIGTIHNYQNNPSRSSSQKPKRKLVHLIQSLTEIESVLNTITSDGSISLYYLNHQVTVQKSGNKWWLFEPNRGKYFFNKVSALARLIFKNAEDIYTRYKKFILTKDELNQEIRFEFVLTVSYFDEKVSQLRQLNFKKKTRPIFNEMLGHELILARDFDSLSALITEASLDINKPWSRSGWCVQRYLPIIPPIWRNNINTVEFFLKAFPTINLNVIDPLLDASPLHMATVAKLKNMVNLLLVQEVNINITNSQGQTSLHFLFLNTFLKNGKKTYLNSYLGTKYGRIISNLPEENFNFIQSLDFNKTTPTITLESPDKELLDSFIDRGADLTIPDIYGQTILHFAAFNASLDIINLLLDHGADPWHSTPEGWAPIHIACAMNHSSVVQLFLSRTPPREKNSNAIERLKKLAENHQNREVLHAINTLNYNSARFFSLSSEYQLPPLTQTPNYGW